MRKLFATAVLSISVIAILCIQSCVKNIGDGYTEPITVIQPDSLNVTYVTKGTVQPISIAFTTDRPILWIKCQYQIDTNNVTNYTYPDTLFYRVLDSTTAQYTNKYTYTGSYTVPDSVAQLTTIRFDVQFKAALNPSSPDTVSYDKQFTMTVR